ncbi:hypothetical protein MBLNU459_g5264t2 [Dothideomycetes sp. NU459]
MILSRQWFMIVLLLVFLLVIFQQFAIIPLSPAVTQLEPFYRFPPKPDNNRFRWENLPIHYPVSSFAPLPSGEARLPKIQHTFTAETEADATVRKERQQEVKAALTRCWHSYRDRAWLADELAPISGLSKNTFGGWAATLVDTLDTLWIMDMKTEFHDATEVLLQIDFTTSTQGDINVFETTIRYLGGFVSAYDLSGDRRLLDKAIEVAEMLYVAFDTPNRMPITRWNVQKAAARDAQLADENVLVAEIGSLCLEFTRLAQITNDNKWYDATQRVMKIFHQQQSSSNLPGMWPLSVNAQKQDFASGSVFTLGAMADSLYEYLPKMHALLGGSSMYESMYTESMAAAIESTMFRPMVPDNADILISGTAHVGSEDALIDLEPQGQHLVCFAGGMLALGGRLVQNETHVELARKLTDGCIWTYKAAPLGIMPETFFMLPCESGESCAWNETKWHAHVSERARDGAASNAFQIIIRDRLPTGFSSIGDRRYVLRPEAIESVFILYRVTGDPVLQDKAWDMFTAIRKYTETEFANAAILDVTDKSAPKYDSMESFWTAETLKYFYLIFSDPDLISLDDYVFNTEAHPFKRPTPSEAYQHA